MVKSLIKNIILFIIFGAMFYGFEVLWRGYSFIQMFIIGGICCLLVGKINSHISWDIPLVDQAGIATVIILCIEFISGYICNICLGMNLWSYKSEPLNILNQICLKYAVIWYFMSFICIIFDDFIRWKFFGEQKPHYKLF